MKFLLWRYSLPLVLDLSSSWAHPPLGYFKAVLMFYDSFPSFLLKKKKKKESQPRHSTSNSANSWCVIWKHIFYCEREGYSRNKKLFLLDQYQFLDGLLPYTPAPPSLSPHTCKHMAVAELNSDISCRTIKFTLERQKVVPEEFLPPIADRLFQRYACGFTYFFWKSL